MAHAARIDETTSKVVRVIVVHNSIEPHVEAWCANTFGGVWKQTSYNSNTRKHFAGIGYTYDQSRDAFIPPQPYPSWTLDEATCDWKPPVPRPAGPGWRWDEATMEWIAL